MWQKRMVWKFEAIVESILPSLILKLSWRKACEYTGLCHRYKLWFPQKIFSQKLHHNLCNSFIVLVQRIFEELFLFYKYLEASFFPVELRYERLYQDVVMFYFQWTEKIQPLWNIRITLPFCTYLDWVELLDCKSKITFVNGRDSTKCAGK